MGKRKFAFYTSWSGKDEMECACLICNPCCDRWKNGKCEEIELTLNPYDDLENVMKSQRPFRRGKGGALKQK